MDDMYVHTGDDGRKRNTRGRQRLSQPKMQLFLHSHFVIHFENEIRGRMGANNRHKQQPSTCTAMRMQETVGMSTSFGTFRHKQQVRKKEGTIQTFLWTTVLQSKSDIRTTLDSYYRYDHVFADHQTLSCYI